MRAALLDHVPYPSVRSYVERLPDGWRSFPECLASVELVERLRSRGALDGLEGLPEPIARLLRGPPPGGWVPEVVFVGALLAVRDARFPGARGELAFLQWVESLNRTLFHGLAAPTPRDAVERVAELWARFHAGTSMTSESVTDDRALVLLSHPPELFPSLSIEARRRALGAAVASAGSARPIVEVARVTRGTCFAIHWA